MKNTLHINKLLQHLLTFGHKEKAGIWQGNNEYKDQNMFVIRNQSLMVDAKGLTKEQIRDYSKADQPWSELHFLERINGIPSNPGETYKIWPYAKFDKENDLYLKGKKFSHTYQERFWPRYAGMIKRIEKKYPNTMMEGIRFEYGDLNNVINTLKNNPLTRQAYLPIWFPEDTWAASRNERVPCTLGYYFWIDRYGLNMNYTIRSCDAFRHFRNDIYLALRLLLYVAKQLNIDMGYMTMIIYNLHIFENDIYAFKKKEFRIRDHEQK